MHIEFSYIPVAYPVIYPVILTIIQSYPHKIRMKKSVVAKEVRSSSVSNNGSGEP